MGSQNGSIFTHVLCHIYAPKSDIKCTSPDGLPTYRKTIFPLVTRARARIHIHYTEVEWTTTSPPRGAATTRWYLQPRRGRRDGGPEDQGPRSGYMHAHCACTSMAEPCACTCCALYSTCSTTCYHPPITTCYAAWYVHCT
jgi:hypothetical protein